MFRKCFLFLTRTIDNVKDSEMLDALGIGWKPCVSALSMADDVILPLHLVTHAAFKGRECLHLLEVLRSQACNAVAQTHGDLNVHGYPSDSHA